MLEAIMNNRNEKDFLDDLILFLTQEGFYYQQEVFVGSSATDIYLENQKVGYGVRTSFTPID